MTLHMTERSRWPAAALLAGLLYLVIGLGTAELARRYGGVVWRWAAWAVSAVVFAAHIAFELRRLRSAPPRAAFHAALAVALGAFGLAAAATIRAVTIASFAAPISSRWWPGRQ